MTTDLIIEDGVDELKHNWQKDLLSGFLVFFIALPLCLGISIASGFPPIAGIFTAIVGGLLVTFLGGANVAIKGPAAGLIVIALGSVTELGELGKSSGDPLIGYKLTLAAIVIAGICQTLLGVLRAGSLSDFFPSSAVHGMLASIGIVIATKQIHVALGVNPEAKEPFGLLAEIPHSIAHLNPSIAVIGLSSLVILFTLPLIKNNTIKKIPAPIIALLLSVPLGMYFGLDHVKDFMDEEGRTIFLVNLPDHILNGIQLPNWSMVGTLTTWKYVIMFTLVGSLESVLSSKAVDILDPYKRKTKMNKDLIGVGIGNIIAGMIGGLPMISEIVRSSANINNGARTKWSNFFHGAFLLLLVALAPSLIHHIPLAALAAMLIFTGYKLASPKVFKETLNVGIGQMIVFLFTILVTLATDLIIGIVAGITMEFFLQIINGVKWKYIFGSKISITDQIKNEYTISVNGVLTFANYLNLKKKIDSFSIKDHLILDLSQVEYIDHTVMENLHYLGEDYHSAGGSLIAIGTERLKLLSAHALADRKLPKGAPKNIVFVSREDKLKLLASQLGFTYVDFNKKITTNFGGFNFNNGVVKYEGNVLSKQIGNLRYTLSDISIVSGGDIKAGVSNLTVLSVSNFCNEVPLFTMMEEKVFDGSFMTDINFADCPMFSSTYRLNGVNETQVRRFFTKELILYFETSAIYTVESLGTELLIYKESKVLSPEGIEEVLSFAYGLVNIILKWQKQ